MIKRLLTVTLVMLSALAWAQTRPGSLRGKVIDKQTGETQPFVPVVVKKGTTIIKSGLTDDEGRYNISPIDPGTYDVEANSMGYQPYKITGVTIEADRPRILDIKLTSESTTLIEVEIFGEPIIDPTKGTTKTIGGEAIKDMAVRDISSIAAQTAGVFQADEGQASYVRGARDGTTIQFIDGVRVRGTLNLPQAAIQSVTVITGGLPAQYGDATGGVISTITRGPTPQYFGSAEYLTSFMFDDYNYHLLGLTTGGPIYSKKDINGNKQTKIGFLLASEFQLQDDSRPFAVPVYKLKDDVLRDLQQNPVRPAFAGTGMLNRAEFITKDDMETQQARLNARNWEARLNGNLTFRTGENANLTLGGRFNYRTGTNVSFVNSLFNYENFGEFRNSDWAGFVRYQQSFSNNSKSDDAADVKKSLIQNAFYTIQMDYTRNNRLSWDPRFKDNFFQYGHVGRFTTYQTRFYGYGQDTASGLFGWRQLLFLDTAVTFEPSTYNPVLANYTSRFYDFVNSGELPGSTASRDFIRLGNALVNGDDPPSVYNGLWGNVGGVISGYNISQASQFRVAASSTFDLKKHSIIVGFEYEQRVDRAYGLAPRGLWSQMFLLQNDHIRELDFGNPLPVYDAFGVFQDTINYNRLFDANKPRTFDRNVRVKLGLDPNGLDWLDINSYDPNMFSLDMFSADELINLGATQYVSYYGYDYTGNILSSRPSLNDFFTKRDENGNLTREIAPFQPIYMAGYIQDEFKFDDLFFRVGVRVDRYDANQPVLKDPYLLYPARTVGDLGGTPLQNAEIPSNIGRDYVVYVNDASNPSDIVGFRRGDSWFNPDGSPQPNPKRIADASGGIQPYLFNADPQSQVLTAESFTDYTPQVNVMPRISFNFPITDEAVFVAHYDVLVQRPDADLSRLDLLQLMQLQVQNNSGQINNPNLLPQKTTEYELGFQQKLTERSGLTISGFYREMRDMMQTISLNEAHPITYVTYGNQDFGTVKGMSLSYELRRTKNVQINAQYTLQFAQGSGSGPNSGVNIARSGQPNLRYILPLDYDSRHVIVVNLDYRYGTDTKYKGPVWWNKKVFENAGVNFVFNTFSGTPYSRRARSYPLTTAENTVLLDGQINGSRLPWQFRIDVRLNKGWDVSYGKKDNKKKLNMEAYIQVQNLLNTMNVLNVYPFTGSPDDDGFLTSQAAQNTIQSQVSVQSFTDLYNIRMANPFNFSLPRRARLGIIVNF